MERILQVPTIFYDPGFDLDQNQEKGLYVLIFVEYLKGGQV